MKILAFTDLHEHLPFFKKIQEKAKEADIIICAGDMTIFEHALHSIIKKIAMLNKPTYIVHGNHESPSHVAKVCEKYPNVHFCHRRVFKLNGISIFGFGGGGFSYKDEEFEKYILQSKKHLSEKNILITHAPPYMTNVDVVMKEHAGNKTIRKYIHLFNLVVSGHLHETSGKKEQIGKTLVINPGPMGKIIEF